MKTTNRLTKTVLVGAATLAAVALVPPLEGATYVSADYQDLSSPIEFAFIGDAGNSNDTVANWFGTYHGAVDYDYYISKYEVTQGQWVDFLNAVATDKNNTNQGILGLYNSTYMGDSSYDAWNGVKRTETVGTYSYSLANSAYAKRPVVFVSLLSAKRFCNWLTNGGGAGDTELGVYDLTAGDNEVRISTEWQKAGAVALPDVNEWYKAAYYDPAKGSSGGYHEYSFGHANGDTVGTSYANYDNSYYNSAGTYRLSPVDYYEDLNNSLSAYGVADMTGNIYEWTDSPHETYTSNRVLRGAAYLNNELELAAGWSDSNGSPGFADDGLGFRVASLAPIPEPAEIGVIGGALVGLLCLLRRKRRAALSH